MDQEIENFTGTEVEEGMEIDSTGIPGVSPDEGSVDKLSSPESDTSSPPVVDANTLSPPQKSPEIVVLQENVKSCAKKELRTGSTVECKIDRVIANSNCISLSFEHYGEIYQGVLIGLNGKLNDKYKSGFVTAKYVHPENRRPLITRPEAQPKKESPYDGSNNSGSENESDNSISSMSYMNNKPAILRIRSSKRGKRAHPPPLLLCSRCRVVVEDTYAKAKQEKQDRDLQIALSARVTTRSGRLRGDSEFSFSTYNNDTSFEGLWKRPSPIPLPPPLEERPAVCGTSSNDFNGRQMPILVDYSGSVTPNDDDGPAELPILTPHNTPSPVKPAPKKVHRKNTGTRPPKISTIKHDPVVEEVPQELPATDRVALSRKRRVIMPKLTLASEVENDTTAIKNKRVKVTDVDKEDGKGTANVRAYQRVRKCAQQQSSTAEVLKVESESRQVQSKTVSKYVRKSAGRRSGTAVKAQQQTNIATVLKVRSESPQVQLGTVRKYVRKSAATMSDTSAKAEQQTNIATGSESQQVQSETVRECDKKPATTTSGSPINIRQWMNSGSESQQIPSKTPVIKISIGQETVLEIPPKHSTPKSTGSKKKSNRKSTKRIHKSKARRKLNFFDNDSDNDDASDPVTTVAQLPKNVHVKTENVTDYSSSIGTDEEGESQKFCTTQGYWPNECKELSERQDKNLNVTDDFERSEDNDEINQSDSSDDNNTEERKEHPFLSEAAGSTVSALRLSINLKRLREAQNSIPLVNVDSNINTDHDDENEQAEEKDDGGQSGNDTSVMTVKGASTKPKEDFTESFPLSCNNTKVQFNVGDVVWGQLGKSKWWPAKIKGIHYSQSVRALTAEMDWFAGFDGEGNTKTLRFENLAPFVAGFSQKFSHQENALSAQYHQGIVDAVMASGFADGESQRGPEAGPETDPDPESEPEPEQD